MNANGDYEYGDYAIETNNLGRKFGNFDAVRGVNMSVQRGTVFGLLGVNGAGKSTIIKMIVGHLRPSTGNVRILGASSKQTPSRYAAASPTSPRIVTSTSG